MQYGRNDKRERKSLRNRMASFFPSLGYHTFDKTVRTFITKSAALNVYEIRSSNNVNQSQSSSKNLVSVNKLRFETKSIRNHSEVRSHTQIFNRRHSFSLSKFVYWAVYSFKSKTVLKTRINTDNFVLFVPYSQYLKTITV